MLVKEFRVDNNYQCLQDGDDRDGERWREMAGDEHTHTFIYFTLSLLNYLF